MKLGIDVMGGDYAPNTSLEGVINAFEKLEPSTRLVLYGTDEMKNSPFFSQLSGYEIKFSVELCSQVIDMHDHTTKAISSKPDSSIVRGLKDQKEGKIDAFISAGNTGAMLAGSVMILGKLKGLHRPTIGALYPTLKGFSYICDVGANMDCKPEHLQHFALLGAFYMSEVMGVENPRVALLNVGEEKGKGNQAVKEAYELIENMNLNFVGNAEGRDLNKHFADVYVCDGFVGNILLKFGESFYDLFKNLNISFSKSDNFNFEKYGGTPFLGVNGNVIIGHGISSALAFENMLISAQTLVNSDFNSKLSKILTV